MQVDAHYDCSVDAEPERYDVIISTRGGSKIKFSAVIEATIRMWEDILNQEKPWTG
jgi:hypothetical protein